MGHLNSIVIGAGNAGLTTAKGLQRSSTQILELHKMLFPPIVKLRSGCVFNPQETPLRQSDHNFGWIYSRVVFATKDVEFRFSVAS